MMKRIIWIVTLTLGALLLVVRGVPLLAGKVPAAEQPAMMVDRAIRSSPVMTLADGLTAYRLTPEYTTTIGGLDFVARIENRPFDQYGRELPYHAGWHYVVVSPTREISPSGRWDLIGASLSSIVTETVSWNASLSETGEMSMTIGDGLIITRPIYAPGITLSMVLTQSNVSPVVAGAISTTRYLSQSGAIVPGSISATLWMAFEVADAARGLVLDYQGVTGSLTIAAEENPVFYSSAANVADFGFVQVQVQAQTPATDTVIAWRPQFAPTTFGGCAGDLAWADGAVARRAFRHPADGPYVWQPMYVWSTTQGLGETGFDIPTGNACVRVAFQGPAGVVFTPTIWLRAINP